MNGYDFVLQLIWQNILIVYKPARLGDRKNKFERNIVDLDKYVNNRRENYFYRFGISIRSDLKLLITLADKKFMNI